MKLRAHVLCRLNLFISYSRRVIQLMSSVEMECFPLKEVPETKCPSETLSLLHSVAHRLSQAVKKNSVWALEEKTVHFQQPVTSVFWVFPWAPQPHPCSCSSHSPLGWNSMTRTAHKHCHWVQIPEMKLVGLEWVEQCPTVAPKAKDQYVTSYVPFLRGQCEDSPSHTCEKETLITHAHTLQPLTLRCLKNHFGRMVCIRNWCPQHWGVCSMMQLLLNLTTAIWNDYCCYYCSHPT